MPPAILDTTLLSNFSHVQRPELLQLVFGKDVATTPAVMVELETGEALGHVPICNWDWLPILTLTEAEQALAVELEQIVETGEAESLAVAQLRQCTFLSDDRAARRLARARGVVVSGTIGATIEQSLLTQRCASVPPTGRGAGSLLLPASDHAVARPTSRSRP